MPVVTLVLDAAQLLAQRRGLGLVGGQGQGEDDLGRDNDVWSHLVWVRVTSSGLKWQSDTERREHCAEIRGRRGRRINM